MNMRYENLVYVYLHIRIILIVWSTERLKLFVV